MTEKKKPRILIADDDLAICETLQEDLSKLPAEVFCVDCGNTAVETMLTWREEGTFPDLVILDMWMPRKSGGVLDKQMGLLLLTSSFQLFPRTTPVLVYTAHENYKECVICLKLGAYDYIPKLEEGQANMDVLIDKCRGLLYPSVERAPEQEWLMRHRGELEPEFCGKYIAIFKSEVAKTAGVIGRDLDGFTIVTANEKDELAKLMIENRILRWEKPRIVSIRHR